MVTKQSLETFPDSAQCLDWNLHLHGTGHYITATANVFRYMTIGCLAFFIATLPLVWYFDSTLLGHGHYFVAR